MFTVATPYCCEFLVDFIAVLGFLIGSAIEFYCSDMCGPEADFRSGLFAVTTDLLLMLFLWM